MKKFIPVLKQTKLFAGVTDHEIEAMLSCLDAQMKAYKKGEYVFRQGEYLNCIAVLVDGGLHIQQDDYWGNRTIVSRIVVGELFGEAYVAPEREPLLNDVIAVEDSVIILFDASRILTTFLLPADFMRWWFKISFSPFPKETESLCKNWAIYQNAPRGKS